MQNKNAERSYSQSGLEPGSASTKWTHKNDVFKSQKNENKHLHFAIVIANLNWFYCCNHSPKEKNKKHTSFLFYGGILY